MIFFYFQFGSQPVENEQPSSAATTVVDEISTVYEKIDKEDEDEEEEQQLKTISFEVNQVRLINHNKINDRLKVYDNTTGTYEVCLFLTCYYTNLQKIVLFYNNVIE